MLTRTLEKLTALDVVDRVIDRAAAAPGRSIFTELADAFGLHTEIEAADLARLPRSGPVIYVCNHPSGFAEGLAVPALLDACRDDVAAMGHRWFGRWPALAARMFLVDPQHEDPRNGRGLLDAVRWVRGGRGLLIMPAGEVAYGRFGSCAADERPWRSGLAKLVRLTGATVVPIHADVRNRRRFHLVSWLHRRLGALLLVRELLAQRGRTVRLRVGRPLTAADLAASGGSAAVTVRCRRAVLELAGSARPTAPDPVPGRQAGGRPWGKPLEMKTRVQ